MPTCMDTSLSMRSILSPSPVLEPAFSPAPHFSYAQLGQRKTLLGLFLLCLLTGAACADPCACEAMGVCEKPMVKEVMNDCDITIRLREFATFKRKLEELSQEASTFEEKLKQCNDAFIDERILKHYDARFDTLQLSGSAGDFVSDSDWATVFRQVISNARPGGLLAGLWHVDFSDTDLSKLPEELKRLDSLGWLSLHNTKKLAHLPEAIGDLHNLHHLELGGGLIDLPTTIGNCVSLKILTILDGRNFRILPREIGKCVSLKTFIINDAKNFRVLPREIEQCSNLKDLRLLNTGLTSLPDLSLLHNLKTLYLSGTKITHIGSHVLPQNLKFLSLKGMVLHESLDWLTELNELNMLIFTNCEVSNIPDEIAKNPKLRFIDLEGTIVRERPLSKIVARMREIRKELGLLPISFGLGDVSEDLSLHGELVDLPTAISKCAFLTRLSLSGAKNVSILPREIEQCSNLEYLNLGGTALTTLPDLSLLHNLEWLDLSETKITHIASHSLPQNLHTLILNRVVFHESLDWLLELNKLTSLYLIKADIPNIPDDIVKNPSLGAISLQGTIVRERPLSEMIARMRAIRKELGLEPINFFVSPEDRTSASR